MKVYLQPKVLNSEDVYLLKTTFPGITFTEDDKDESIDIVIAYPQFITRERINNYRNLKWAQLLSAGFDTIDEDILNRQDLVLTNAKGIYSITIAEDVICRILMINRNVKKYLENMKVHEWKPLKQEFELYGATVGIVGVGSIGKEIAKRLQAFNVKVIGYRRHYELEPYFDEIFIGEEGLETLLKTSDYVILALPLNKESYHLINASRLQLMKKDAVLINIARGDIINQDDLIKALENNQLRAVSLDVVTPEPLPKDHQLWTFDNVYLTPHNSLYGPQISSRLKDLIIENLNNFIQDKRLMNLMNLISHN